MADEDKLKRETYELLGGINQKVSTYLNGQNEFRTLVNMNFVNPGALTKRPGTSLYLGATVSGRITGGTEFERLNGASYVVATANTNAYTVTSSFNAFRTGLANGALFDFVTLVDRLFCANGQDFFKFDGTNHSNYSLPLPPAGVTAYGIAGGTLVAGTYQVSYGYLNDRGYYGPGSTAISVTVGGGATGAIKFDGLTTLTGYGITALSFYRTTPGGVAQFGTTSIPMGATTYTDLGAALGTRAAPESLFFTLAPRYLEIYNNQMFMAGFSSIPSTIYWSDIGEPESVDPTYFAEFRTNDGDRVMGMKAYQGSLMVFKERSFHRLTGDNPDNFQLSEISDQYGCVSNRALVVYENYLLFLDPKGIGEYDGASIKISSTKLEPIFNAMNLAAARDNAVAVHYRRFNEVWFAIPINGSTINNCIVVFDYVANAWTTYEGIDASVLFVAKGSQPEKTVFYGGYTGSLSYFGASLFGDNGQGITCLFNTMYHVEGPRTGTRLWRRFYLDVDPISGVTQSIPCTFNTDYGSSVALAATMYQAPFQSRLDFGLPAKSIQAQVGHYSATLPFKVNGYAFESRYLRSV